MSIRFIDIQTNITGSNQVSDIRQRQQQVEQLHQTNPQGQTSEAQRKLTEEVNEVEADPNIDPDAKNKEEQEAKKRKKKAEEEKKAAQKEGPRLSDGVRGHKLDFSV